MITNTEISWVKKSNMIEVFFYGKIIKIKKDINFYLDDFMEYCILKDLSKKTLNSSESTLLLFIKYIEEYQIVDIQKVKKEHI